MKYLIPALLVCAIAAAVQSFVAGPCSASETGTKRAPVIAFLKQNVVDRAFIRQSTQRIDDGRVEAVFSRTMTLTDLCETDDGLSFKAVAVIKQANFDLDTNGRRSGSVSTTDRILVVHFKVVEMKSTGALLGVSEIEATTLPPSGGGFSAIRLELRGEKLIMNDSTIAYVDQFAAGGKYKPGDHETEWEFFLKDGKLQVTEKTRSFDVDPQTLARSNPDKLSEFLSRQE